MSTKIRQVCHVISPMFTCTSWTEMMRPTSWATSRSNTTLFRLSTNDRWTKTVCKLFALLKNDQTKCILSLINHQHCHLYQIISSSADMCSYACLSIAFKQWQSIGIPLTIWKWWRPSHSDESFIHKRVLNFNVQL